MKTETSLHGAGESSGSRFFTWAIILAAAGLLVAMTADITRTQATTTHTVQTDAQQTQS
ncbi:MAG: hypothetical protein JO261_02725 [Alphaproteobacteria bacterium]|nr:hypothetical protein [Alphaproteobacteria bacterium]MBV9692593.1 hypothetical protein [Alphaproteobacteria bacterium]